MRQSAKKAVLAIIISTCILNFAIAAGPSNKNNWNACMRYWYHLNVDPTVPKSTKGLWKLRDRGNGIRIENWNVPGHSAPTNKWLKDNETDAVAWHKTEQSDMDSDYTKWTARERAIIDIFRKLVKPEKTEAEIIDLIKAELNNQ